VPENIALHQERNNARRPARILHTILELDLAMLLRPLRPKREIVVVDENVKGIKALLRQLDRIHEWYGHERHRGQAHTQALPA
jgi:16S rRNA G1207 methylase RsmC